MKKIVIFGLNKLSELMHYYITTETDYEIAAFTVDDAYCNQDTFMDKPVIPFSKLKEEYPSDTHTVLLTIGYTKMNTIRKIKFKEIKELGYEVMNYIHSTSTFFGSEIGEGNIILENCAVGPFVKMGDANIIYPSTVIAHHSTMGSYNFFSVGCAMAGDVVTGDGCFFGVNCTIRNDVHIADYTLVGAGSYINRDTEENGVYTPPHSIKLDKSSLDINI